MRREVDWIHSAKPDQVASERRSHTVSPTSLPHRACASFGVVHPLLASDTGRGGLYAPTGARRFDPVKGHTLAPCQGMDTMTNASNEADVGSATEIPQKELLDKYGTRNPHLALMNSEALADQIRTMYSCSKADLGEVVADGDAHEVRVEAVFNVDDFPEVFSNVE